MQTTVIPQFALLVLPSGAFRKPKHYTEGNQDQEVELDVTPFLLNFIWKFQVTFMQNKDLNVWQLQH